MEPATHIVSEGKKVGLRVVMCISTEVDMSTRKIKNHTLAETTVWTHLLLDQNNLSSSICLLL